MNRHIVAGMLGMVLAGCAQYRSDLPPNGPTAPPVGLTALPSIHDAINRENPHVNPLALRADVARESGGQLAGLPVAAVDAGPPTPTTGPAPAASPPGPAPEQLAAAPEPVPAGPEPAPTTVPEPAPDATLAAAPAPEASPVTPSDSFPAQEVTPAPLPPSVAPEPIPAALAPVARSEPDPATPATAPEPTPAPGPDPSLGVSPDAVPLASLPPQPGPEPARLPEPSAPAPLPPATGPATPAPGPDPSLGLSPDAVPSPELPPVSASLPPATEPPVPATAPIASPTVAPVPAPGPDPSLGLSPDAVPSPELPPASVSLPPASEPPATASIASPTVAPVPAPGPDPSLGLSPDAVPTAALPPLSEPPAPAPGPAPTAPAILAPEAAPAPEAPAPGPDPSVGASPDAVPPIDLPPLPPEGSAPPRAAARGPSASADAPRDPGVEVTSATQEATLRSRNKPRELKEAGKAAAQVGDEIITLHELTVLVKKRLKTLPPGQVPNREQINILAASVLEDMIEQNMILQEARRELKNPKQLQIFTDMADKAFREEELPHLLKKSGAADEFELKQKMADQDQSYDDLRESFRRQFLAKGYLQSKLGKKMTVELPEMRVYYNEHLKNYDRPALITWREVVVEVGKNPGRVEARQKADALLARLVRGEDFAKVARSDSDGPNRTGGGLWETSPGSYALESVNAALDSLPVGQISQVIESPSSYHIVKVESRRAAGPASFAEVQDQIRDAVYREKVQRESSGFIAKIRGQTMIKTMFDGTESAPASTRNPEGM